MYQDDTLYMLTYLIILTLVISFLLRNSLTSHCLNAGKSVSSNCLVIALVWLSTTAHRIIFWPPRIFVIYRAFHFTRNVQRTWINTNMNRNCRSDLSKTECDVEVVQKLAGEFRVNVENGSQVIETDFV